VVGKSLHHQGAVILLVNNNTKGKVRQRSVNRG
jgi:hypothetical protein